MDETANRHHDPKTARQAMGLIAAFLTGAGVTAAAMLAIRQIRSAGENLGLDDLLDRCDRLAGDLDRRLSDGEPLSA
jgi:hypothetical protein